MKGCSLRCLWCHNPEGLTEKPELMYRAQRCIGCGRCLTTCGPGHSMENGVMKPNREKHPPGFPCVALCPNNALQVCGRDSTVDEIFAEVVKDRPYYERSKGGVTFSGGECLLYPDFIAGVCARCKSESIHTCVESAFHIPWKSIETVMDGTDLFLVDIKHADDETHRKITGAGNQTIIGNLHRLSQKNTEIRVRIPLVPGINDTDSNLKKTAGIVRDIGGAIRTVELLKYNILAEGKYSALGKKMKFHCDHTQTEEEIAQIGERMVEWLGPDIALIV